MALRDIEKKRLMLYDFAMKQLESDELCSDKDRENIEELSDEFRIGKCEMRIFNNGRDEQSKQGRVLRFYDSGIADGRSRIRREVTEDGSLNAIYTYQKAGEPEWNEEEQLLIDEFNRLFFLNKIRIRMRRLLSDATFKDASTGMPNIRYATRNMAMLINQGRISEYAAILFNIRGMNDINSQVGQDMGTSIMVRYANMLGECLRRDELETIVRIGGDNFFIICKKDRVSHIAELLEGVIIPYGKSAGDRIVVSACAGIYMIGGDVKAVHEIMNAVSSTCNIAHFVYKVPVLYYDEKLIQLMHKARRVESDFENAVQDNEFHVFYQPKVSLKDYRLVGAEALCRWIKDDNVISPASFIPVLEKSKRICSLDFYMLENVCRDIRRWIDDGIKAVPVSVNFSRRHLNNADIVKDIIDVIDQYNVPHDLIEIEVTETSTESDFMQLKRMVVGLKEQGISTAVDDFGTGYSSLSMIKNLPFKVLKIDKSFLSKENANFKYDNIMMKHVIGMATELDMECIAEGVETMDNVKLLMNNKCYLAQGYLFDKPLIKMEFEKRMITSVYSI